MGAWDGHEAYDFGWGVGMAWNLGGRLESSRKVQEVLAGREVLQTGLHQFQSSVVFLHGRLVLGFGSGRPDCSRQPC